MDKGYIERQVERKSFLYHHPKGGGIILIVFGGIITFISLISVPILAILGIIFIIWGAFYEKLVRSSSHNEYEKNYKQMLRDKVIRQEELREAQLNVLKKGHKEIHLIGKMKKLK